MKFLNEIDGAKRLAEDSSNRLVSDTEKTAITHTNRDVIDDLSDVAGTLYYNGVALGGTGGSSPNLTLTALTLGHYKIVFNSETDKLEFQYSLT